MLGPVDRPSPAPSGAPPRSATSNRSRCPPRCRRIRLEPGVSAPVVSADSTGGERREDAAGRKTGNGSAVARDRDRSSPDHRCSAAPRGVKPLSQNSGTTLATVCCKRFRSTADSCARVSRARALFLQPDSTPDWSAYAARARRSSTVELRSVSRRSKRPAQSEARSGTASMLAAVASPSSARTSTASSR